ncbi:BnaC05g29420D [Brassica napus]|uniref:BnaC05g29420D protein n=1 Tax=Brassica napus TaxID=3708 RepID=A0A078FBD4_BRANA|nr:BnaC05g29420D [Brassica napus]
MDESDARNIRNICILAHVDHGKTTLADHLIASSGDGELLKPRLAGKVRYMDYLDEEQRRAITMKSSSISLRYKDYSLNLIDSPGHMDFCSEVSTAARLSDGALVLVDAVEGVHIQTHAVLRQAWIEKLTPCLVLNKIDRLICELRLSPMEAYTRLIRIVHEVNGIVSAYKSEKYLSDVDSILASPSGEITDESLELLEDDEEVTFQPQKGNVVFVCALDGWGFGVSEFANFYASKLGAKADTLQKSLWGPRYYIPKTKMIVGKKSLSAGSKTKPMFVQFVLDPLWQVYEAALDPGVMSRWLPLSDAVLSMAYIQEAELHSIYLMMGQGLKPVNEVKAGNVVAIRGLGPYISKCATLSSTRNCWPLASMEFQVSPTLRVAIEPSDPSDMSALMKGLRLLNRADPFVEITVSARGEHVLAAAGEVHLERCIKDLIDRFARVNIEVSSPLVSYRETIEGDGSNLLESLTSLSLNTWD